MVRSILAILMIAVFAVGASAYDFLYTGDTPMTHDAGAFGISGGVVYLMADSWYDNDGEKMSPDDFELLTDWSGTHTWIPINVYYAAMDNLELGVQPKFAMLKFEQTYDIGRDETTYDYEGSGLGDTWVWAKYMFAPDPMVTARVGLKVNTGTEPDEEGLDEDGDLATGDGQIDIDGAIMFGTEAGPGTFSGAVGYRYRMDQEVTYDDGSRAEVTGDYTPGNEIHFAAGYTYYISDMMSLSIAADGFFGSDPELDGKPIEFDTGAGTATVAGANGVWVNPGFSYIMENGVELGVGFHYPLTGQNIDALWGLDAYVAWGM